MTYNMTHGHMDMDMDTDMDMDMDMDMEWRLDHLHDMSDELA